MDAAGLYVPGGLATYPSSVLMNAIPAQVAGVGRLVMCVPTPDGVLNPMVLLAAQMSGVTEVYRIGGAQAIAAMAYGTDTIAPVDKITGPGNAFVAAAKRRVFGRVGIDMIAGPSEILVIADSDNDPDWIAIDLLSQAEHDESAQSILITTDAAFGQAVADAVTARLESLERANIAGPSWRDFGAVITVGDLDEAAKLSNRIAPEHLELAVADPEALSDKITHAGAIFLGQWTPEAIGDYVGGPNYVALSAHDRPYRPDPYRRRQSADPYGGNRAGTGRRHLRSAGRQQLFPRRRWGARRALRPVAGHSRTPSGLRHQHRHRQGR